MVPLSRKIKIFTGHFGSGKTEIALNTALKEGKGTLIVDVDTVNPYFRSNDAKEFLKENGIYIIAPTFASTNIDMPTLPETVLSAFNHDGLVIFDVGGDSDGAFALGGYKKWFDINDYEMFLVVNTCRPLTETKEDIVSYAKEIEYASRLKLTGIINNSNLSYLTDRSVIEKGKKICQEASEILNIPLSFTSARSDIAKDDEFRINIILDNPYYFKEE